MWWRMQVICMEPYCLIAFAVLFLVVVPLIILASCIPDKLPRSTAVTIIFIASALALFKVGILAGKDMSCYHIKDQYVRPYYTLKEYIENKVDNKDEQALLQLAEELVQEDFFMNPRENLLESSRFSLWVDKVASQQD